MRGSFRKRRLDELDSAGGSRQDPDGKPSCDEIVDKLPQTAADPKHKPSWPLRSSSVSCSGSMRLRWATAGIHENASAELRTDTHEIVAEYCAFMERSDATGPLHDLASYVSTTQRYSRGDQTVRRYRT
jgi:hypothetical protein